MTTDGEALENSILLRESWKERLIRVSGREKILNGLGDPFFCVITIKCKCACTMNVIYPQSLYCILH